LDVKYVLLIFFFEKEIVEIETEYSQAELKRRYQTKAVWI